jgi:murein DD-endopeptidase MepM/ murein hydrolase activator NlpD
MNKKLLFLLLFLVLTAGVYFISAQLNNSNFYTEAEVLEQEITELEVDTVEVIPAEPTLLFGIPADSFEIVQDKVKRHQNLSEILLPFNIDYTTISTLANNSRKVFDVRKIAANKNITLFCDKDSARTARYLVYEPSLTEYVVFNLRDSLSVSLRNKEVTVEEKSIFGTISSSLAQSVADAGGSAALTSMLVDVYAWQIDFFRIQKGDWFKVIYEEKLVDGQPVGVGKILAVQFEHEGRQFQAYYFDQGSGTDYFDEEGNSLRKAFLKAPLNFTRISSRYTPRRFHPVQKRWKAHLGTDYAAPTGTPIQTVGDGVVVEAGYNSGNGNYVKVKHNGTYTTQYLHMSRIAKGMRKGAHVKQGQTIGFVGSTGLATGPHLCFRFWKNGKQVDALKVEIPPSEPIESEHLDTFNQVRERYAQRLATIELTEPMELQAGL